LHRKPTLQAEYLPLRCRGIAFGDDEEAKNIQSSSLQ
jgi:hypothetical protein